MTVPQQVTLAYTPTAKQRTFHAAPAKFRLLLGAYGSGKTKMLIWEDIQQALDFPGSLGVVYRKFYPSLRDTTKKEYLDALPAELVQQVIRSEGREEVEFVNGSKTWFRCLDDWRKVGSTQFDRISVDEAWEISYADYKVLAYGRLRGKIGPRRIVVASNPPQRDHWLHKEFVELPTADKAIFHFSTYDTAQYLPDGYIRDLESQPEQFKRKFLFGEWGAISNGAPVFTAFRTDLHTGDFRTIPGVPIIRGWDFGYHHPACLAPSHRVLCADLRWRAVGDLRVGDGLLAFDEFPDTTGAGGRSRCWRPSTVTAASSATKPCLRVTLDDGTVFTCSTDHRFLVTMRFADGGRPHRNTWVQATELEIGDRLPRFFTPWDHPHTYDAGWVSGFYDGEGSVTARDAHLTIAISQVKNGLLDRLQLLLARDGFTVSRSAQHDGRPNHHDTERLYLSGGWSEHIRFLGSYRPSRLVEKYRRLLADRGPHMQKEYLARVVSIEDAGPQDVVVLETSTRTYIAEGYGQHNCVWLQFAPSGHVIVLHELLGTDEDIITFGNRVITASSQWFTDQTEFQDYVDASGSYSSARNDRSDSCVAVLAKEFGLRPRYRKLGIHQSILRLQYLLETMPLGKPLLRFDRGGCPLLIDAVAGGYAMDNKTDEPKKDGYYDHLVDALRYACVGGGITNQAASPYAGRRLPASWRVTAGL